MVFVLAFSNLASVVVVGGALMYKYWKTRDGGFLWLAVALVLWPVLRVGLTVTIAQLTDGRPSVLGLNSADSIVALFHIADMVGRALIVVGVLTLYRGTTSLRARSDDGEPAMESADMREA